jgi:hypothetical protein
MSEAQKTPAAKWRQEGQADPHGNHYNCQRAALTLGQLTDDELANGVFLHGNEPLNINALLRKTPGYHSAVVWLAAGKDRIRWLSRALEESKAREQALQLRLNTADQRIDELVISEAALREEVFSQRAKIEKLEQQVEFVVNERDAAEQRNAVLVELLRECQPALDKAGYSTWQIDDALKLTESGASE